MPRELDYPAFNIIGKTSTFVSLPIFDIFLSKTSVTQLKSYLKVGSKAVKGDDINKLWKNLLLDAISILKINDTRERYNSEFQTIHTATKSFTSTSEYETTRIYCSYGIDDLDKYFKDFTKFEAVLYGTDNNYRDHVGHVLNVWLIGIYILSNNGSLFKFPNNVSLIDKNYSFEITVEDLKTHLAKKSSGKLNYLFVTKSEVYAAWTIIALCHDLGYPIEKATRLNEKLKNILSYFGTSKFDEFHYDFGLLNKFLVEKCLDFTSSKITYIINLETLLSKSFEENEKPYSKDIGFTSIQSKYRDKFAKSLEDYRHGILSGLLLYKTLTYFLESDYSYNKELMSYEDLRQFHLRKEILRAIAGHTCPKVYHLDLKNLSFLLILCDELQEWGRPNFDDLRYGSRIDLEVLRINLDVIKFSDTESDELRVSFYYPVEEFLKDKEKREDVIKKKFKFFHQLLRSAKDDSKRSFLFRWKIIFEGDHHNSYVYRFRFKSSKGSDIETIKTSMYQYQIKNRNAIVKQDNFPIYDE